MIRHRAKRRFYARRNFIYVPFSDGGKMRPPEEPSESRQSSRPANSANLINELSMIVFFAPMPRRAKGLSALRFITGWIVGRLKRKPLRAFWVGVEDVYAAHSEAHALRLAIEDGDTSLTLDDIDEVSGPSLSHPIPDETEHPHTLAELLQKARTPGWIASARG